MTRTGAVSFHSLARLSGYRGPAHSGSSSHTDGSLMVCLHLICIQKSSRLVAVKTDDCVRASSVRDSRRGATPHLKRTRCTITKTCFSLFIALNISGLRKQIY